MKTGLYQALIIQVLVLFISAFAVACGKSEKPNTHEKEEDKLTVLEKQIEVNAAGGVIYSTFSSNHKVMTSSSASWCVAEVVEGAQSNNLKLTIASNPGNERVAGVLLRTAGGIVIEIKVTQNKTGTSGSENGDLGEGLAINVASYNIRYNAAADEASGNGWDIRKEAIARLVRHYDFDIFGTQEGYPTKPLDDLKALMPEYNFVRHPYGASSVNSQSYLGILYKKAEFEVLGDGMFWLSETPDKKSLGWDATDLRICHWAKFKHSKTGQLFFFFNTHFFHQNKIAREESGPLVLSKIREIAGDLPVVLTGDFNSRPSEPQILTILTQLKDAFDVTESPKLGPIGTAFPGGVFEGTPNPKSRIDYIFVSNHIRVLTYAALNDTYNNGRYPSDHLPVLSKIFIKKTD